MTGSNASSPTASSPLLLLLARLGDPHERLTYVRELLRCSSETADKGAQLALVLFTIHLLAEIQTLQYAAENAAQPAAAPPRHRRSSIDPSAPNAVVRRRASQAAMRGSMSAATSLVGLGLGAKPSDSMPNQAIAKLSGLESRRRSSVRLTPMMPAAGRVVNGHGPSESSSTSSENDQGDTSARRNSLRPVKHLRYALWRQVITQLYLSPTALLTLPAQVAQDPAVMAVSQAHTKATRVEMLQEACFACLRYVALADKATLEVDQQPGSLWDSFGTLSLPTLSSATHHELHRLAELPTPQAKRAIMINLLASLVSMREYGFGLQSSRKRSAFDLKTLQTAGMVTGDTTPRLTNSESIPSLPKEDESAICAFLNLATDSNASERYLSTLLADSLNRGVGRRPSRAALAPPDADEGDDEREETVEPCQPRAPTPALSDISTEEATIMEHSVATEARRQTVSGDKMRWFFGETPTGLGPAAQITDPREHRRRHSSYSLLTLKVKPSISNIRTETAETGAVTVTRQTFVTEDISDLTPSSKSHFRHSMIQMPSESPISELAVSTSTTEHSLSSALDGEEVALLHAQHERSAFSDSELISTPKNRRSSVASKMPSLGNINNAQPFADLAIRQAVDATPLGSTLMPPTVNNLDLASRQVLVKRSRKLQDMLGATLNEKAHNDLVSSAMPASRQLLDVDALEHPEGGNTPMGPSSASPAFPQRQSLDNPVRPAAVSKHSSYFFTSSESEDFASSDAMSRNSSAVGSTTDYTSPEIGRMRDTKDLDPWSCAPGDFTRAEQLRAREERRRKLNKLQRLLGERVPVSLALGYSAPLTPREEKRRSSVMRMSTRQVGAMLRRTSSRLGVLKRTGSRDSLRTGNRSDLSEDDGQIGSMSDGGAPSVGDLLRAQKLEKILGKMPPAGYCYGPRSAGSGTPRRTRGSSLDESDVTEDDEERQVKPMSRQASRLSAFGYITASLDWATQHDTSLLDDAASIYGTADSTLSPSTADEPCKACASPLVSSEETHERRHDVLCKRAAKLARYFGTTSALMTKIIDDIEADLRDEDEMGMISPAEFSTLSAQIQKLRLRAV
ncbi:uncharacterized protein L969DRAFT_91132 [Mixia osmundae IAM 14324]|nr:uncharacterized protein L969DRAFT_91132 [Mixia osmundae IAM 14324]KEI36286.1 hypothetical protein L969DRAFT_91132 [Mixia osmundae IAM 14324]